MNISEDIPKEVLDYILGDIGMFPKIDIEMPFWDTTERCDEFPEYFIPDSSMMGFNYSEKAKLIYNMLIL